MMAQRYWLFKSEPSCFSIDDLAGSPNQTAPWDGVRNYQARNLLRDEIRKGDGVLFYHSGANPPGVVGICEVVRDGYPDNTALDPNAERYDPKATRDHPIWYMVDVKFKRKLRRTIPLSTLKKTPGLENMMVTRKGVMLSVQPVTDGEWKIIMKLAGGK